VNAGADEESVLRSRGGAKTMSLLEQLDALEAEESDLGVLQEQLKVHIATNCKKLKNASTYCNTLQHTATHYNALQHTATHGSRKI